MPRRVEEDRQEFRRIIRGELHKKLKAFIKNGRLLRKRGKDGRFIVSVPSIDIPNFRFGKNQQGVGRGKGDEGDVIGQDPNSGDEPGEPGEEAGEHTLVAVDLDEVLDLLKEELELPNIEPKQNEKFTVEQYRYTGIKKTGPDSLRHIRRTMREAMIRLIESGDYDEDDPIVIPSPDDMRYKSWRVVQKPISNAVIFFMRDYSGSMDERKREIVSDCSWWIDSWISRFYDKTERVYVGHDTEATILDSSKFYGFTSGGGTRISSAFELAKEQVELLYDPKMWNIYLFYFSDLENWGNDNQRVIELMREQVDHINLFGLVGTFAYYSHYMSSTHLLDEIKKDEILGPSDRVRTFNLKSEMEKMDVIKTLLGRVPT